MNHYTYKGPVLSFGRVLISNWRAETYAESHAKARSNLSYRFKKENNLVASASITLPGLIVADN